MLAHQLFGVSEDHGVQTVLNRKQSMVRDVSPITGAGSGNGVPSALPRARLSEGFDLASSPGPRHTGTRPRP